MYLKVVLFAFAVFAGAAGPHVCEGALVGGFRPPAVPLIAYDPYFSVWSPSDKLTDSWPMLWDGTIKAFVGMIRIDGVAFRFMGPASQAGGSLPSPATQKSLTVYPTRTVYVFEQSGVRLTVTFTTPLLPNSLDLLSRPVTYFTLDVVSIDSKTHAVQLYYDNTAEIAVNTVDQTVRWARGTTKGGLFTLRIGTDSQKVLGRSGDRVGIDWGYMYLSTNSMNTTSTIANALDARNGFASSGKLPGDTTRGQPVQASDGWPVLAVAWDLSITSTPVQKVLMLAYDDIYSINYFGTNLQAYWKTLYSDVQDLLDQAWKDYSSLSEEAASFDNKLITTLANVGGDEYATVAALAYRQTLAGTKMTWHPTYKTAWYFMKEISSDGDVSTVDVIFPACPLFLYLSPELLTLQLLPVLDYAANGTSSKYSLVWAPHHLGTWPIANIRTDQQENMPIEETANMLLMIASIIKLGGQSTVKSFYPKYWNLISQWGDYLITALPDPEDQLCTDDFEGPIPHDANLAVKGILGLAAASQIAQAAGESAYEQKYKSVSGDYASKWLTLANPNKTDHYRLRYDQDGWSLKYNLLFQYVLQTKTYPDSVRDTELAWYLKKMNQYGVPLDVRSDFTKLDWESWVAATAPDHNDFLKIIHAIYAFANTTPDRVPLTDWYFTSTDRQRGFQARTVVGGVYAKMIVPK